MIKGITESLAGRVALLDLLGLSQSELYIQANTSEPFIPTIEWIRKAQETVKAPVALPDVFKSIWLGSFPKLHKEKNISRDIFYQSYIATYIQRDVKDILNISDETAFLCFLRAAAARSGKLLNYVDMARDVSIDQKTAKAWLSVLEASGLVYLLQPYYRNITNRIVKTPKLYFLDTGLCAYLTKWPTAGSLEAGSMSGAILETYVFSEILKSYWHNGVQPYLYYYRDKDQKEVNLVIETADTLYPIEIKKTGTPSRTASKHFRVLEKLGKKVGHGVIFCFIAEDVMLSKDVTAIPIGYL